MFKLPGQTIGDTWYVVRDGVAHCFFCTSPEPDADWHWEARAVDSGGFPPRLTRDDGAFTNW